MSDFSDFSAASRVSRRSVLQSLTAVCAGLVSLPTAVRALERRADHLVETGMRRPPIGLQLYTVRTLMARDVSGTLAAIAAAGVREVEFAGYHDLAPSAMAQLLSTHGLSAPAAHVPIPSSISGWTPALDAAQALGHRWLVVPWVGNDVRASLDGWRKLADQLNEAGQLASSRGVRVAYHNHDFEFRTTDGRIAYDVLLERLDPRVVDLELDLYWAVKAGQDVPALLAKHPGRFPLWHLKDAGAPPEREMLDVGAGTINFGALFAHADASALKHAFIEHDQPKDPLASVQASAAALQRLP